MRKVACLLLASLGIFSFIFASSQKRFPHKIGIMLASLPSEYWWYEKNEMEMLEGFLKQVRKEGVQFIRLLLYYPVNSISQVNIRKNGVYAPFKVNRQLKAFNLGAFEERYWRGFRRTLLLLRKYSIIPVVSVLDYPERHREISRHKSFWFVNVQGLKGFRDRRFVGFARLLVKKTVREAKNVLGNRWYLELGNEFSFPGSEIILRSLMLSVTEELGFPVNKIIVPFSPKYDGFKNLVFCSASKGQVRWKWKIIPAYHFSTLEAFAADCRRPEWKWMMDRFHVFFFSTDGFQGDKKDKKLVLKLLNMAFQEVVVKKHKTLIFEEQPAWIGERRKIDNFFLMHSLFLMPKGWIASLREEMIKLQYQD